MKTALLLPLALALFTPSLSHAAADARFDGSRNTVTEAPVLGGTGDARHSFDLTAGPASRSLDNGEAPPAPDNGGGMLGGLGQYKSGLIGGAAVGGIAALLAFGLGFTPVGIAGMALIGAGAGLGLMGKSQNEHLIGAGLGGAGIGLGLALAMGMPFGWPVVALAAAGAAVTAGAVYLFGGK